MEAQQIRLNCSVTQEKVTIRVACTYVPGGIGDDSGSIQKVRECSLEGQCWSDGNWQRCPVRLMNVGEH